MSRIRPAINDDIPDIFALAKIMHGSSRYKKISFDNNTTWNLIRACIDDPDRFGWVGVNEDEEIVSAFLGGVCQFHFSTETMATDYGVFTEPTHRKSRLAFKLMQQFIKWANERGCSEVSLGASHGFDQNNYASRLGKFLQKRLGFTEAGIWYVRDANV
jgi:GNAT superfamily N-acetyltransferase